MLVDHLFAAYADPDAGTRSDLTARHELLRARILHHLAGYDAHSCATSAIGAVLDRACLLYVLGFPEASLRECQARLDALLAVRHPGLGSFIERAAAEASLVGDRAIPPDAASALVILAERCAALGARDAALGRSILIEAPAQGRASGGIGCARADSPTSRRKWNADLHDLLARGAVAVTRWLEQANAEPLRV
ncbi:hypothetical protein LBMAG53_05610 [Planctomycetota bacterium]|nr:hypothetical protein LBMAG53_05610 [Planctomycetota bacterium]